MTATWPILFHPEFFHSCLRFVCCDFALFKICKHTFASAFLDDFLAVVLEYQYVDIIAIWLVLRSSQSLSYDVIKPHKKSETHLKRRQIQDTNLKKAIEGWVLHLVLLIHCLMFNMNFTIMSGCHIPMLCLITAETVLLYGGWPSQLKHMHKSNWGSFPLSNGRDNHGKMFATSPPTNTLWCLCVFFVFPHFDFNDATMVYFYSLLVFIV